jgi:hypothetical protein
MLLARGLCPRPGWCYHLRARPGEEGDIEWRVRDGSCNRRGDKGFSLANADIIKACRLKHS